MQNLINHIIKQEKEYWNLYQLAIEAYGKESPSTLMWSYMWLGYRNMIVDYNLTAPKRNLRQFKSKKFTTSKTTEE